MPEPARSPAPEPSGADDLLPQVYDELHRLAQHVFRGQPAGHTLQPTALVHEAWLRLRGSGVAYHDRRHVFCVAARAMRQILVNHARDRGRRKRGGDWQRVALDGALVASADGAQPDLEALDRALHLLAEVDARKARVVELRYFAGLTVEQTADVLRVSSGTVKADWRAARAWLLQRLDEQDRRGR